MLLKKEKTEIMKRVRSKIITKIAIAAVIVFGGIVISIYFIDRTAGALSDMAEKFQSGKVTTEFRDYVTQIKGFQRLQVASLNTVDIFTKLDSRSVFWNMIDLPDVQVEIKIPVEYSYYLDLNNAWRFDWNDKDKTVTIFAPQIKSNTPAIDLSSMSVTIQKGSFLRDEEEVKEKLIGELSGRLLELADKKIPLIRETARNEVRQFISNWFIKNYFKDSEVKPVIESVVFSDESISSGKTKIGINTYFENSK